MTTQPSIHPYLATIREQYVALQDEAQNRQEANPEKRYEVAIEYHTPAGEEIVSITYTCTHASALYRLRAGMRTVTPATWSPIHKARRSF